LNYPRITTGLGKLTPKLFERLMVLLKAFESGKIGNSNESNSGVVATPTSSEGLKRPYFLAKITGSTLITDEFNRYEYDWTEVVLDDAYSFAARSNARTGTVADETAALNLCEMSNTVNTVGAGIDVGAANYPTGFAMMPIGKAGDGTLIDVVVVMFNIRDVTGALRSAFSLANAHDGTCS
jgi:hypothetical protein